MAAGGVGKFFYWSLTTGCNIVLLLNLMKQIRNLLVFTLIVMKINQVLAYFLLVFTGLQTTTIYLAFIGSIRNVHSLIVPFFVDQTIYFMYQFGLGIDRIMKSFETSTFEGLMYIVDYHLFECGYYIGLMFIMFSRYKEIEVLQRNRLFIL